MREVTRRKHAQNALAAIKEAITAELLESGPGGMRNDDAARSLGLQTSVNGGQRNHLTHVPLNELVGNGILIRRSEGRYIYYTHRDRADIQV